VRRTKTGGEQGESYRQTNTLGLNDVFKRSRLSRKRSHSGFGWREDRGTYQNQIQKTRANSIAALGSPCPIERGPDLQDEDHQGAFDIYQSESREAQQGTAAEVRTGRWKMTRVGTSSDAREEQVRGGEII